MNITEICKNGCPCVVVEGVTCFDIGKIFDCGQCFRFDPVPNSEHEKEFSGVAFGRVVSFAQDGDTLYIYGSNLYDYENVWKPYLNIERDYDEIFADILEHCQNEALSSSLEYGQGIRILSQDAFECIISFIVSQNNNIPRIKKIIEALCATCGDQIAVPEEMKKHLSGRSSLCTFPDADALVRLGEEGLFELKTGFRAKYIYDASRRILDNKLILDKIYDEDDIERAIDMLCTVKGIGRKVASCALLFGFEKYNAFPVDVWMKRVALKYFGEEGESLSWEHFGEYAGIAQQYLFYYERYRSLEK